MFALHSEPSGEPNICESKWKATIDQLNDFNEYRNLLASRLQSLPDYILQCLESGVFKEVTPRGPFESGEIGKEIVLGRIFSLMSQSLHPNYPYPCIVEGKPANF